MLEIDVLNGPSVFEPLKFYCMYRKSLDNRICSFSHEYKVNYGSIHY